MIPFRRFILVMTPLFFLTLSTAAQQSALTGTVTDSTGAVIPGATVSLTHKGTNAVRSVTTSADGGYILPLLQPGEYRLEISMDGFRTVVQDPMTIQVGITSTFNTSLEVGQVTEEVIVEGGVATLNTVDASMGTPLTNAEVSRLPILDLDPTRLLNLQAGVTFVAGDAEIESGYGGVSDFDGRGGSVNGSRSDQSNITLDGIDANDVENGYAFVSVMRTTQAALQEFRVTTTNYTADAGRSSAAQVQLVTKSGTNDLHGELYYTNRNEFFSANEYFTDTTAKLHRHIYGAAFGGPLVEDRFFLFGNWERFEESKGTQIEREVPSMNFRDGVFIYECQDPGGLAPCPTTQTTVNGISGATYTIPAGFYGLSPAEMVALDPLLIGASPELITHMQGYPVPNSTGNFDGLNIVGFRFLAPIENTLNTYILKADFNADTEGKHKLFWRGNLMDDTVVQAPQFPGLPPNQSLLDDTKGFAMGYTATINPNLVNDFRWGLSRLKQATAGNQTQAYVSIRFLDNLEDYGSNTFGRTIPLWQLRDDVSYIRGNHTFTFGGNTRSTRNDRFSNANSYQFYSSNPSWLPNGGRALLPGHPDCVVAGCTAVPGVVEVQSYIDGMVNLFGVISDGTAAYNYDRTGATLPEGALVERRFAVDEWEAYAQDQWRVNPELTLTFGIQYSRGTPPWETNGNQVAPRVTDPVTGQIIPGMGLNDWFEERRRLMSQGLSTSLAGDLTFDLGGKANNATGFYETDDNNFSPRIAAAWAPNIDNWFFGNGKTVFRGGYSIVFDRIGPALAQTFDAGGSFGMSTNIDAAFGGCSVGDPLQTDNGLCPRFTGVFDTTNVTDSGPDGIFGNADDVPHLTPAPPGGFPSTPPQFFVLIASALDDSIKTPYAHTINFSIQRELPGDMTLETAYVGRRGRDLLMVRDLAQPANVVDPVSGQNLYDATAELVRLGELVATGQLDWTAVPNVDFFENMFPSFGPTGVNGGFLWIDSLDVLSGPDGIGGTADDLAGAGWSATQVALDWVIGDHGTEAAGSGFGATSSWLVWDFCFPGCMLGQPGDPDLDADGLPDAGFFAIFPTQYGDIQALGSVARSEYHSLQVTLRRPLVDGILFNLNYTLSKSLDHSSTPERAGIFSPFFNGGYTGSTINTWDLDQVYSFSDFDMRNQFNARWLAELPFGRGKAIGGDAEGWVDQIIGGWEFSGITRINSGLPAGVINGRTWPTNWDLQGNATCSQSGAYKFGVSRGPCPATQNVSNADNASDPNIFADPVAAFESFRFTEPGQSGPRNNLRGSGYFSLDFGLGKTFHLPTEGHQVLFRWDVFNATNSTFFDTAFLNASVGRPGSFGRYTDRLGQERIMQLSLRYEF